MLTLFGHMMTILPRFAMSMTKTMKMTMMQKNDNDDDDVILHQERTNLGNGAVPPGPAHQTGYSAHPDRFR